MVYHRMRLTESIVRANATASAEDRLTDSEVIGQVGFV